MKVLDRFNQYVEIAKIHLKNEHLTDEVSHYAFLLSLLPIPGVQQAGQVIDKIFADQSLKNRLGTIWEEINTANSRITTIEDEIERLQVIAATVKFNSGLDEKVAATVNEIVAVIENSTEWILETEDWSFQSVLNSIVEADIAQIISKNNSTNSIKDTEITAKKTVLRASNNSSNYVENSNFNTGSGSVGMDGINTRGDISIASGLESLGNDAGFGVMGGAFTRMTPGSAIIFGGNPYLRLGICTFCNAQMQVDTRAIARQKFIICSNCHKMLIIDYSDDA